MVSGWRETTELSSLIASSTTSRLAAFFRSRIAVLKSLFVPLLNPKKKKKRNKKHNQTPINDQSKNLDQKKKKNQLREEKNRDPRAYESDDSAWFDIFGSRAEGRARDSCLQSK